MLMLNSSRPQNRELLLDYLNIQARYPGYVREIFISCYKLLAPTMRSEKLLGLPIRRSSHWMLNAVM